MPYSLPPTLSPSRVSAFTECALAYRFANLDRLPEPPSPHATKGTLVHAALESLFTRPATERTPEVAAACLDAAAEAMRSDPEFVGLGLDDEGAATFVADAHRLLGAYFAMEDPRSINAVGLELRLEAEVGGVTLRGVIDRLDRLDDGSFVVNDYKGLALDTPLPTPSGWTTMEEISEGDEVLGQNGRPTRVVAKSAIHHRPCYRIRFSDNSDIVCDNEHLWNVGQVGAAPRGSRADKTVNSDELYAMHQQCRAEGRPRSLVIANAEPLELPRKPLPLDPWLLGVWLGDGDSRSGTITIGADDLPDMLTQLSTLPFEIRREASSGAARVNLTRPKPQLCPSGHPYDGASRRRGDRSYRICRTCRSLENRRRFARTDRAPSNRWNVSLTAVLRSLDLLRNKHIPAEYLRASLGQRIALLQGLMDTDGHWHAGRRRAVLVTTSGALASGAREILHSLGITTYEFTQRHVNRVRPDCVIHRIEFRPVGFNPFRLPRKAGPAEEFTRDPGNGRSWTFSGHATRRSLIDIQPIPSVPTQCIAVDAADSMYLCGRSMIPTHNTGTAPSERYERSRLLGVDTYALLVEKVLGVRPVAVRLLYLGDGIAITCRPSAETGRFIEAKVGAIWQTIQRANATDAFKPKPGRLCDWCAFQAFCPAFGGDPAEARRLGEELRAEREQARREAALADGTLPALDDPLPFDTAFAPTPSAAATAAG